MTLIEITHADEFVKLLSRSLLNGYAYLTSAQLKDRAEEGSESAIGNGLLGSISEFAVYVLKRAKEAIRPPLIHCFRAPDPLGAANFPLVDIGTFRAGKDSTKDRLYMQEVKATRSNPEYFSKCEADYGGLYATSRLVSTVEHMKWDIQQHVKLRRLIPRINDCIGTCPTDSAKVRLIPTGVSGDAAAKDACVKRMEKIVGNLKQVGWPAVRGMYVRIPDIEKRYQEFALGKGAQR